ncbi:MAG: hypothetical protein JNK67_00840, partial [Alphaproteobacteria bacterium]|nr:hypothetical protein [Alphaproteobacteria bacterium]
EWVHRPVPPIVSEALWEEANTILNHTASKLKRTGRPAVHPFAGLTVCECGTKMYVFANSPKYVCKGCKNKIAASDLDRIFQSELEGFFLSDEEMDRYAKDAQTALSGKAEQLSVLEAEHRKVKGELDKLYRLYMDDGITVADYRPRNRALSDRLAELDETIPRLQAEIDLEKIDHLSRDQVRGEAKDLFSRWPEMAPAEKRQIVESLTDQITIGKDDVHLKLLYSLPNPRSQQKATHSHGLAAATSWTREG